MKYRIPFILPSFPKPEDIAEDLSAIIKSNWYTNFGPFENKLCLGIADYIGKDVVVCTTSNATAALDVAVKALFSKSSRRRKVIIPAFTFAAGGNVILMNNFEPVFIDINKQWQPDISQAEDYLSSNTSVAGILLCNIFGVGNRQIEDWEILAKKYKVPLIIDSAAGFGSMYSGSERLGRRGDCEIFSLHATKPFSVGEGGIITSKNHKLISTCRSLTNFGFDSARKVTRVGTNAKLNEISCSIGVLQLAKLADRIKIRQKSYDLYRKALEPQGFIFQDNSNISSVAFVSILAPTKSIATSLVDTLIQNGVESKQYYDPLNRHPAFADFSSGPYPLNFTNDLADRMVCLPLHDNMPEDIIHEIITIMESVEA